MSDLNKVIKTSLEVLPHLENNVWTLQKCKIPSELYRSLQESNHYVKSEIVAKCTESLDGEEFICKLYPLENIYSAYYCYLDESVRLNGEKTVSTITTTDEEKNNDDLILKKVRKISSIEILNIEKEPATEISVIVKINQNALKNELMSLTITAVIKNILKLYLLTNKTIAKVNSLDFFGITEINIVESSYPSSSVFRIDSETTVKINDIKCTNYEWIYFTEIEGLKDIESILDEFLIDCDELQMKLAKVLKPSLMVLISGLSGSGKTSLCHNFFIRHSCNVFKIEPTNVIGQYPGESEENLRNIFQNAIKFAEMFKPKHPTAIFIENVELFCSSSKSHNSTVNENSLRLKSQFLALLDLIHSLDLKILVIATTSDIESVDLSSRRPGRFQHEISIPLLNENARRNILRNFLREFYDKEKLCDDDFENVPKIIAEQCVGYSGADMQLLIKRFYHDIFRLRNYNYKNMQLNEIKEKLKKIVITLRPSSIRCSEITCINCNEKFDDVGGMLKLKKTLQVSVLTALQNPDAFHRFGLSLPKGILFYGPPGCAKTMIAKCLANETKMRFISASGAEVYSPYVGKSEKYISKLFDVARKNTPCIIFLDEIDTLIGNRSVKDSSNDVQTRVLSTLLTEMDGVGINLKNFTIKQHDIQILMIAATNRPDLIDDALMRPGRFDKLIHIPAPDQESRLGIFEIFKKRIPFDNETINLQYLSEITENYSGADICNLCNEAAIQAFTDHPNIEIVTRDDIEKILKTFKPSLTLKQIEWYYQFEKRFKS